MIKIKEIENQATWEDFISQSYLPASFFQSWLWGEFEKSLSKELRRLGIYLDDKLYGVGQVSLVNARRGRFLHFRNGPVMPWENKETVREIFLQIKEFAKDYAIDFIRISPLVAAGSQAEKTLRDLHFVNSQMHDVDAEVTWVLDLAHSNEEILTNMRKQTRYSIRKAEKEGVKIVKTQDPKAIADFWPVYSDTVERQKWHAYSKEYIAGEFAIFAARDCAQLFLAEYQGKIISAAIFLYFNGVAYYHHSGSLGAFRHIPAAYLIQWESILEAKRRNLEKYNFFGIASTDDPGHPWHGLTFFKKGFGGHEERWMHAKDLPIKNRYWFTHFFEKLERKKRGY